jgi:mRNA interferase RelE/StbE
MENKYNISIIKKAEKFIKTQDKDTQRRIIKAIIELPQGDIKKLKGMDEIYRLRVGDLRILFEKNDKELKLSLLILEIEDRFTNK